MRYWTHELLVPIDFSPTEFLVMRLNIGDELGLLKKIVPELCRHSEDVNHYRWKAVSKMSGLGHREDVDAGPTSSSSS